MDVEVDQAVPVRHQEGHILLTGGLRVPDIPGQAEERALQLGIAAHVQLRQAVLSAAQAHHRDYLGCEDLFCTVLLCILATSS